MPFDYRQFGLGWDADNEKQHAPAVSSLMCAAAPMGGTIPDSFSPPLEPNNQLKRNSCDGNALDKALECDNWMETGQIINLSARFSYLIAKMEGGTLNGPDQGATVSGAAIAASKHGACTEDVLPYWTDDEPYSVDIPQSAFDMGRHHLLGSFCDIPSMDFGFKFLGTKQGGMLFGVPLFQSMAEYDGSQQVITRVRGQVLGGHAMAWLGYQTIGGQLVPEIWNSWSAQWGNRGKMLVDPDLFWKLVQSGGFGIRGVSKLPSFVNRLERFENLMG